MLLLFGIPVFVWMKWRRGREIPAPVEEPEHVDVPRLKVPVSKTNRGPGPRGARGPLKGGVMRRVIIMGPEDATSTTSMSSFVTTRTRRSSPSRPPRFRASTTVSIPPRSPELGTRRDRNPAGGGTRGAHRTEAVDEVILAYSDLAHEDVMHKASTVLAAGADFTLLGPKATMLRSTRPVVAVCAARTGCGKSQTSRHVGQLLMEAGLSGRARATPNALRRSRVDARSALRDDRGHRCLRPDGRRAGGVRDAGRARHGDVRGRRLGDILEQAQAEADVVIWDGGNNDLPFYAPDLHVVVVDPLRPGHELCTTPARRTSAWPISSS